MKNHENQIIKGLIKGREDAYKQLFHDYYRVLSVFATKYVGDIEIAKEIVQDFFVHLFEIRETMSITTSLKSYLFQSVRNRCLNYIKHLHAHQKHVEEIIISKETSENPEDRIKEAELEHLIFAVVEELPERCKNIFKLSRVEGKKNQEIADKLNISKRTVETQISKALKVLREKLKGYL